MNLNFVHLCLALLLTLRVSYATVPSRFSTQPAEWFPSAEGLRIADNVLTWQSPHGSWPKNTDTASNPFAGKTNELHGTFDNGATTSELIFLAKAARTAGEPRHKAGFLKGLDHILQSQYPNGGFPQQFPTGTGYHRHITFNDNSMVRILEFLRAANSSADYSFVDADRRARAKTAFDRGIQCIVAAQIVVNGKPTAWCAQHDEVDLRPRPARTYELESLSGAESAGILKLLMSLENPTPEIRRAIQAGAAWFDSAKITGVRIDKINGNKVVVADPAAPPLWARFYEIETNRPFFCGRDGIKKYDIAEIEAERRNGYAWHGDWGRTVAEAFAKWQRANPSP
jgi:PelA/Pel-15E family pectate lyase